VLSRGGSRGVCEALVLEPVTETPEESLNVTVNWMSALKK
jgi:hypothetical protein